MNILDKKISIIKTNKGNVMGQFYNDKPYLIGFIWKREAQRVVRFVHEDTKMDIVYLSDTRAHLTIAKKININKLPCHIEDIELVNFMTYPFMKNLGILFVYDALIENDEDIIYDSQIITPLDNMQVFRNFI